MTRVAFVVLCWLVLILLLGTGSASAGASDPALNRFRFAIIGDFGVAGEWNRLVSGMVKSWVPEFIITLGDNNYYYGEQETIDANIGQYYHSFIAPYHGGYGAGSADGNRFFPTLGNHDWRTPNATPYINYFREAMPSLEFGGYFYDFRKGPVHFFALDSDEKDPYGLPNATSFQAMWLKRKLEETDAPHRIVYFHHSPYTSSVEDGPVKRMRWPFRDWGASIVITGHDHVYERLVEDHWLDSDNVLDGGLTYVVNGIGGNPTLYPFTSPRANGSLVAYNSSWGAIAVDVTEEEMNFEARSLDGESPTIDQFTIKAWKPWSPHDPTPSPPVPPKPHSKRHLPLFISIASFFGICIAVVIGYAFWKKRKRREAATAISAETIQQDGQEELSSLTVADGV